MTIYFLGTDSGTEPMLNRHHTAFAIEVQNRVYWFDAGENCSYTAHILGLDLLNVEKIIISHAHMDHVGGLANLLWNIRKISRVKKEKPRYNGNQVYIPCRETWDGIMMILRNSEGLFSTDYPVQATQIVEGELFDDGIMRVVAFPNTHLKKWQTPERGSFSFLIECEGKKLVYSGDVGSYEDLNSVIGQGCDGLIIETGHHNIDRVYEYCKDKKIDKIFFMHHGREILNDESTATEKVWNLFGDSACVCKDGMIVDF